ncbi:unnamed protein product, partial [Prorocentrum cordatum]
PDIDDASQSCKQKMNVQALSQAPFQRDIDSAFADFMAAERWEAEQTPDELNSSMVNDFSISAAACLPQTRQTPRHPWINDVTLELIAARRRAQAGGHLALEKTLNGRIEASVKIDKRI